MRKIVKNRVLYALDIAWGGGGGQTGKKIVITQIILV